MKKKNTGGFIGVLIIGIIAVVIAGVVAYVVVQKNETPTSEQSEKTEKVSVNKPVSESGQIPTVAGWKTYKNDKYGFEVKYPKDWQTPIERGKGHLSLYALELNSNAKGEISFNLKVTNKNEALNYETVDKGIGLALNPGFSGFHLEDCRPPVKLVSIGPNNYPAKLISVLPDDNCFSKTRFYFIQKGDYDYFIGSNAYENPQIKEILSTFKFLD